jgi:4-diphosphocytidyl-2-C-methyl-D-erythritol kinase
MPLPDLDPMSLTRLYDLPAPAKLNLFLHVIGRRDDGYHRIESAFTLIDWTDTLHFELRRDGKLLRRDLGRALPADDLCLRAARALQAASGSALGAEISIVKRIPAEAGLGGGSSDAATVLLALNRLWGCGFSRERLLSLALRLGADVPFFVFGRNALAQGIGEALLPLELPPACYAVVKPAQGLSTAVIFSDARLVRDTPSVMIEGLLGSAAVQGLHQGARKGSGFGRNDLQAVAAAHCPEVAQALNWLADRFGASRMTGSGSAVFASIGAGGSTLATTLAGLPAGWAGRLCRSLPEHPLRAFAD